jgi:AraC-like DNA-binding protein
VSLKLVSDYKKNEVNEVSFYQSAVSYLQVYLIFIGFSITAWLASFLSNNYFHYSIPAVKYDTVWIGVSLFTYVIGYYSLRHPRIFRFEIENKKTSSQRLGTKECALITEKLNRELVEHKIFLDPKLTLSDLAISIEVSANDLSWYLNNEIKISFYDLINQHRIDAFIKKVKDGDNRSYTLLALALDAGFNSKSTFNKVFKAEMNDTPSNFVKNLM